MRRQLFLLSIFVFLFVPIASAQTLPANLQKIQQYNQEQALYYVTNISFVVAFLAGILSFLSPCILPLIPAFFSYTFKEKKNITKMTFFFFLGFSFMFTIMGILAGFLGESIAGLQIRYPSWVSIAGLFLVGFGILSIFGKGFSSIIQFKRVPGQDTFGIFLFGIFFALGWTACVGPILAGVLLIGTTLKNYALTGLLFFVYSLGIAVPLFTLSFVYDKLDLHQKKWLNGKPLEFALFGKKIYTNYVSVFAGILLIFMGVVFIVYRGTYLINGFDPLHIKPYFYSLQDKLFTAQKYLLFSVAIILFSGLTYIVWKGLRKR
ncbi:cytochrome c biogenesis protein CcdA [Candidatus Woesearchaeota archaeon]|nr:cytochrome c biogenesis protein CcdA [Candidatus Woesearchaeota archaeon]